MSRRIVRNATTDEKTIRVSPKAINEVSSYRKASLEEDIINGNLVEGNSLRGSVLVRGGTEAPPNPNPEPRRSEWISAVPGMNKTASNKTGDFSAVGAVVHSESFKENGFKKRGSGTLTSSGSSSGTSAGGAVERLAPEVYSPLFTMANLNLPRDRLTTNAWIRNYYQLHPIVRNAITLHATYPISKLNLKCADKKVLKFFEDMVEEMNLMESLGDVSLEYFKLGEVFPYAELDETTGKWKKLVIQNPDYIFVKKTVLSGDPIISLKPDAVLQRLVMSNNPADIQLRKQIPEKILYHIRAGQDIPLDNFNVSHLKMLASPYDVRGTSMIVSIFKDLMLFDKIRECYSSDTEFLTEGGFKYYDEITENDRLATFNKDTNLLEYQNYTDRIKREHNGDMYHFTGKKLDVLVTPGHRMWMSKYTSRKGFGKFDFINASDVKKTLKYKSLSSANWIGKEIDEVDICGNKIPIEEYLKVLGHIISEGHIKYDEIKGQYCVSTSQATKSSDYESIKGSFEQFCYYMNKKVSVGTTINEKSIVKSFRCYSKKIAKYISTEIGMRAGTKRIPNWVKELSPRLLKILINSLVEGDALVATGGFRGDTVGYIYSTISKQLADDVQEIVFKCGCAPIVKKIKNGQGKDYFSINWSRDTDFGKTPLIQHNGKRAGKIEKIEYNGDVVCFTVPNDLLITRRNGKISIQGNCKFAQADGMINPITIIKVGGNSDGEYRATAEDIEYFRQLFEEAQYDRDFKLITHAGVSVERVGFSGQVLEVASDLEFIVKNIYTGLMVPPALIDTESAVYSSASIGLEVLRQRYFNFRNMIANWLINKIFVPISEIQEFYEYVDGSKRLIVPEVEWNQMNLYDLQDYIQNITGLISNKQASVQTLYRSLGLNYEDETVKMRREMIDQTIRMKEEEAMRKMTITELKALDPEKEVMEAVDSVEREGAGAPGVMPEAGGMPGGMSGMPGGDLGGLGGPGGAPGGLGGAGAPPMGELAPPPAAPAPPGGTPPGSGMPPGPGRPI